MGHSWAELKVGKLPFFYLSTTTYGRISKIKSIIFGAFILVKDMAVWHFKVNIPLVKKLIISGLVEILVSVKKLFVDYFRCTQYMCGMS